MKRLYQCKDQVEAQLVKDYLLSFHIETVLHGNYLAGAAGELSALQFPELWLVDERDYDRSRQLIEAYLNAPADPNAIPWQCPVCREEVDAGFELCWNCSTPKDE